jgi:predicted DNA-binding protein YlxM (UPF0122 family)
MENSITKTTATTVQDDIIKLYTNGYSLNDIVEITGFTKQNVNNILKSYKLI